MATIEMTKASREVIPGSLLLNPVSDYLLKKNTG
jgi:hypothetical protein